MTKIKIALLCLLTLSFSTTAQTIDYIVAVINDEVITHTTLQRGIQDAQLRLKEQGIQSPPLADLEKQVLQHLIITQLQLQLAQRLGVTVDDNSLNETLRQIAAKKQMDLQTFREKLEQEGYNFARFREDIRNEMVTQNLQQREVVNRISVTDREIENFLTNLVQQGSLGEEYHLLHILIATPEGASAEQIEEKRRRAEEVATSLRGGADFQQTAVSLSDGQQALEGGDLGWRKAGEVPALFAETVNNMAVGDIGGPVRNASGFHIIKLAEKRNSQKSIVTQIKARHILIKTSELVSDLEAKTRLENLKLRIENGDDFASIAQATSEDTASAAEGGLIGWTGPGDVVPEFEQVVNGLAEKQLSEPFKSRYGWHLVQVLERRQHDNTTEALRLKATERVRQRKTEEELQSWLRQLRDESFVEYRTQK